MADKVEVAEGLLEQTSDEKVAYKITTTNLISNPTSPTVVAYDVATNEDVTADVGALTASASGDDITTSLVQSLKVGRTYRIEVKFSVGSIVREGYIRIYCPI